MKNLVNKPTKEEIKKAKQIAFSYIYGNKNLILDVVPRLDMRFRVSRLALFFFKENQITDDIRFEVKRKRRERNLNNPGRFVNYLNNPLLLDFYKSRNSVQEVYIDKIKFCGRNHWAKTQNDLIVLSVLKKVFYK